MRKKLASIVGVAAALTMCFATFSCIRSEKARAAGDAAFDEKNIALTVGILSDVHVGYEDQEKETRTVFRVMKDRADMDAVLFAGDVTQMGTVDEIRKFRSVVESEFDLTKTASVLPFGNHDTAFPASVSRATWAMELGDGFYTFDTADTDKNAGNRHVVKNGVHFLAVECDDYGSPHTYKQETQDWLDEMLGKITRETPDMPVFVASHPAVTNTVIGSVEGVDEWVNISSKTLTPILSKYPQVIYFSGHSHYPIYTDRAIMQTDFTAIHVASLQDTTTDGDFVEGCNGGMLSENRADVMIAEMDKGGNVRITRLDCLRNEVIDEPWVISAPSADKSHLLRYSAARAEKDPPKFDADAKVRVQYLSDTVAEISVDPAHDARYVDYYAVRIYKGEQSFPAKMLKTVTPRWRYSDWKNLPAQRVTVSMDDIAPPYRVEVRAYDSWDNESEPIETVITERTYARENAENALAVPGLKNSLAGAGKATRTENGYLIGEDRDGEFLITNDYLQGATFYDADTDTYLDGSELGYVYEFDVTIGKYRDATGWFGAGFYFCSVDKDLLYVRFLQNASVYLMSSDSTTHAAGSIPNRELARGMNVRQGNTLHVTLRVTAEGRISLYVNDGKDKPIVNDADFYEFCGVSETQNVTFAPGIYSVGCEASFENLSLRFAENVSAPRIQPRSEELLTADSALQGGVTFPETVYLLNKYSYTEVPSSGQTAVLSAQVNSPVEIVFRREGGIDWKIVFAQSEAAVYAGDQRLCAAEVKYPVAARLVSSEEFSALYLGDEELRFGGSDAAHCFRASDTDAISGASLKFANDVSLTRPAEETYPVKPPVPEANTEYIAPPLPDRGSVKQKGCKSELKSADMFAAFAALAAAAIVIFLGKEKLQ